MYLIARIRLMLLFCLAALAAGTLVAAEKPAAHNDTPSDTSEAKPEPKIYAPLPGQEPDANGDGLSDVENILRKIDELATTGVHFDDEAPDGYLAPLRKDGKIHMACIDLLHVVYRAAGYDIPRAMRGGRLLDPDPVPQGKGAGFFRSVVNTVDFMRRSPNFHFYACPEINLVANRRWRPRVPFKIGDMFFVHYNDANDRHSGIVTGVDPATGLPTHITQVSIYNENQGLHRATVDEFFSMKCRMITGYARPACWDGDPIVDPSPLRPREKTAVIAKKPVRATHGTQASRRRQRFREAALPELDGSRASR